MRHTTRFLLAGLFLVLGTLLFTTARAELRTWKAAVGNFSTEAEFVELKDGKLVRLQMKDGTQRDIPLDRLSAADQDYVAKKTAKPASTNVSSSPSVSSPTAPSATAVISGPPGAERLAKLEKDTARCRSAEEVLRLYRVFLDDPAITDTDRRVIEPKISELRSLAERKMMRLNGEWVTSEAFKQNRDKANSLIKQGLEMMRLKQEDQFRKKFAEAAALEPDNVRAEFLIGLLYAVIGHDPNKAKQYFDSCLKRDPENVATLNNLALALVRKGDTQNAAMYWRRAADLMPDQHIVQNLGRFLDLAAQKKIAASKGTIDTVSNVYGTLVSSGKFEAADLKRGWSYMLVDADSLSLSDDDDKKEDAAKDNRPPTGEDGSVVIGGGTGWVVHPNYILSNNHVVDGGSSYDIQVNDGDKLKMMKATLVAVQKSPDLALLKCDELDAPPLTIDATLLRRGTDIMTLGYPEMFKLGASLKATRGVISAIPSSALDDMYLYDAVVNPGNSGGPVFDNHGNVVAVTTVLYMTAGRYGGGIPSSAVLKFVKTHIPNFSGSAPPKEVMEWPAIDQKVSPSTVLIWTRSKTMVEGKAPPADDYVEDKTCMACDGRRGIKCTGKGCNNGIITIKGKKSACRECGGKGYVACPECKGGGIELALIPPPIMPRFIIIPPRSSSPPRTSPTTPSRPTLPPSRRPTSPSKKK